MRENTEIDNFLQKRHHDKKGKEYIENLTVVLNEAKVSGLCHSRIMRKSLTSTRKSLMSVVMNAAIFVCIYIYVLDYWHTYAYIMIQLEF